MGYKDKSKQAEYARAYYEKNKEKAAAATKRSKERRYQEANALKSDSCTDCGEKFPPYVMHWDHRGTDKLGNVSRLVRDASWERVLAEVAKCDLVCANCHAIRTYKTGRNLHRYEDHLEPEARARRVSLSR